MTISFGKTIPPPEGDPNRNVSDRTGGISGAVTRTRDRADAAAAMRRDADENRPQTEIERAGDYYFQKYQREQAAKKSREKAEFLKQCQRAERERVIAERIKFLCDECGFTVERATEHVRGKM
jgi:hypothetical protein